MLEKLAEEYYDGKRIELLGSRPGATVDGKPPAALQVRIDGERVELSTNSLEISDCLYAARQFIDFLRA